MKRRHTGSAIASLLFLAACATGSGGGGGAPATLSFGVPAGGANTYLQFDTMVISVDAGGQMVDINGVNSATVDMTYTATEGGVEISAVWREMEAVMTNPMGPAQTITEEDIDGPLVFRLDRRARGELLEAPRLNATAAGMFSPSATTHTFFPTLPGTPPTPGMAWTDTIQFEADEGEGHVTNRTVASYTLVGDTVVGGVNLVRIDVQTQENSSVEGSMQGMSVFQEVAGSQRGFVLWDLAAGVMHSRYLEGEFEGTMDVDAAPFPMALSVRTASHTALAGG